MSDDNDWTPVKKRRTILRSLNPSQVYIRFGESTSKCGRKSRYMTVYIGNEVADKLNLAAADCVEILTSKSRPNLIRIYKVNTGNGYKLNSPRLSNARSFSFGCDDDFNISIKKTRAAPFKIVDDELTDKYLLIDFTREVVMSSDAKV